MPPKKKVDAPSAACFLASISTGLDVMIAVNNVTDGHGELDALITQDALDEGNFFFLSRRDAVAHGNTMYLSCYLAHREIYLAYVLLIVGPAPGFYFLE